MKNTYKYFCLLLLSVGFVQIECREESLTRADVSKMSATELDASFVEAVKSQRPEEVEQLLQAGANVNTPIPYVWTAGDCDWDIETTALIYAVRRNLPDMVRVLVKVENNLNEALDKAISEGYIGVVEELVQGGADVNYVYEDGDTPLIRAVEGAFAISEFSTQAQWRTQSRWHQRRKIIQTLLDAGADINHVNKFGRTALMYAVVEYDLNTVEKLLQHSDFESASINHADNDGNTALMLAIKNARFQYIDSQEFKILENSQTILGLLVEVPGIDFFQANKAGETVLSLLEKFIDKVDDLL